ncbi:NUDIX hydrolase [Bradyrhizobium sp. 83012]|uniref:NUDIX hydrolase n=1 Tax=Bradyrhizobium aeschynomenes TaxID=2734909 RepID=A0ABX2CEF8_9BRAD|nr:NUDIX hydrolase [Bradyrhizobium aeschynomenes]NPU09651.1 NUDIX hydrolase [Bradyrhizobium aeschynomenes]NPU65855.1 NUDIX hydrolase [Bradyrhizobium aeschynomenes]
MPDVIIHRVTALDLKVEPWDWPFAQARRDDIAAHFAERQREKPGLWNGRILLGRDARFENGQFSASYFETDFASLLAWRDWGFPDRTAFNGFGMGALRAADGAFVLGEMGAHTANAGRLYFPAGTPDLADVDGGTLDLAANVAREVEEETGLRPADYRASPHWDCVMTGATIAMMRVLDAPETGDVLQRRIEANLAAQHEPELSAIQLVRSRDDLTAAMPRFVTAFLETQFDAGETS